VHQLHHTSTPNAPDTPDRPGRRAPAGARAGRRRQGGVSRCRFVIKPMNICDLLSVAPVYTEAAPDAANDSFNNKYIYNIENNICNEIRWTSIYTRRLCRHRRPPARTSGEALLRVGRRSSKGPRRRGSPLAWRGPAPIFPAAWPRRWPPSPPRGLHEGAGRRCRSSAGLPGDPPDPRRGRLRGPGFGAGGSLERVACFEASRLCATRPACFSLRAPAARCLRPFRGG